MEPTRTQPCRCLAHAEKTDTDQQMEPTSTQPCRCLAYAENEGIRPAAASQRQLACLHMHMPLHLCLLFLTHVQCFVGPMCPGKAIQYDSPWEGWGIHLKALVSQWLQVGTPVVAKRAKAMYKQDGGGVRPGLLGRGLRLAVVCVSQ